MVFADRSKNGWSFDPYTDLVQIHPVRSIGDYSVVDVKIVGDNFPFRYFLRNNKVILELSDGVFKKLWVTSPSDDRNRRKIKYSATGRFTVSKLLEKEAQGLIHIEHIPDKEVLKIIPAAVLKKFGYDVPKVEKGVPFLIGYRHGGK